MLKKIMAGLLVCTSLGVVGCNKSSSEVSNKNFTTEMTNEDVSTYKSIGEKAVEDLDKKAAADIVYRAKYEAIYQAVFTREAASLASKVNVTNTDVDAWLKDNPSKSQMRVLKLDSAEDWNYYLYPDDPLTKGKTLKVGDDFLGAKILEINESNDAAKRLEAEENIRSAKLVEAVNERVSHVIDIRSEE